MKLFRQYVLEFFLSSLRNVYHVYIFIFVKRLMIIKSFYVSMQKSPYIIKLSLVSPAKFLSYIIFIQIIILCICVPVKNYPRKNFHYRHDASLSGIKSTFFCCVWIVKSIIFMYIILSRDVYKCVFIMYTLFN